MRHRASAGCLALVLLAARSGCAWASPGTEPPITIEPPITYVSCGEDDMTVELTDTAAGPRVTMRRGGHPLAATSDVNLAHRSRRLFFTLRDERTIIEFQGRATTAELAGRLNEGGTSRPIHLMAASPGACDKR